MVIERDGLARALRVAGAGVCGAAVLTSCGGCSDRLLRENVLATTQSVVGVSVGQHPQTGLYEGTIGYARSELFLVPTSKRVVYDELGNEIAVDELAEVSDPSGTPEVVGEIRVIGEGVGGVGGVGAGVYQRLAVGKIAVSSRAAAELMGARAAASMSDARARLLGELDEIEGALGRERLDSIARDRLGVSYIQARITASQTELAGLAASARAEQGGAR